MSTSPVGTAAFSPEERESLLKVAQDAIEQGLQYGAPGSLELTRFSPALQATLASFVTLKLDDQLRGCIGSLEALRPLVEDVNENAYAAAFRDPRFPPMTAYELEELRISISVLTTPQLINFDSEQDLLAQLRPGVDGLILEAGHRRGTFLPAVWESLPDAADFLRHLKSKAGLFPDYWSAEVKVYRYRTEIIGGD